MSIEGTAKGIRRRGSLGRWLILIALLVAAGLVVVSIRQVRLLAQPTQTLFRATLNTRSLAFAAGELPDNGGIFNSDTARVNLVLTSPAVLESADSTVASTGQSVRTCVANATLENVRLVRVSIPPNLQVALDAQRSGVLQYTLTPRNTDPGSAPYLSVVTDSHSNSKGLACTPEAPLADGEWRIRAPEPSDFLEFSVAFLGSAPRSVASSAKLRRLPLVAPPPEQGIRLADQSSLLLRGDSTIPDRKSELRLIRSGRVVQVVDGVKLRNLDRAAIEELAFDPAHASLTATLVGSAMNIAVIVGENDINEGDTRWSVNRPHNLNALLSSGGTVIAPFATVLAAMVSLITWWIARQDKKRTRKSDGKDG